MLALLLFALTTQAVIGTASEQAMKPPVGRNYRNPATVPNPYENPATQPKSYENPDTKPNAYENPATIPNAYENPATVPNAYEKPATEPKPTSMASTTTAKEPCLPCREVIEGPLQGYYDLISEDDVRCDDGCLYISTVGYSSKKFCFVPGGYVTKLECQPPAVLY